MPNVTDLNLGPISNFERKVTPELRDAAKRASDAINLHITARGWDELKNKYMAIKLADGSSDGVLYDTRRDAVRHQTDERLCAYVSFRHLGGGGSTPREMAIFLAMNREAYDNGMRLTDPDDQQGGKEILPTAAWTDYFRGKLGL